MAENVQCPVCTLYLHAGMNLSDHLETHPKEQVIRALVQLTISGTGIGITSSNTLASVLGGESSLGNATKKSSADLEEKPLSSIKGNDLNKSSADNSSSDNLSNSVSNYSLSNQSVNSSQNSNKSNFSDTKIEQHNENEQDKISTSSSIVPIKTAVKSETTNSVAMTKNNLAGIENMSQGFAKQNFNQAILGSNLTNENHSHHRKSLELINAANSVHNNFTAFGGNARFEHQQRDGVNNQNQLSTLPHMPPPPPPPSTQNQHSGQHQEVGGRGISPTGSSGTFHSIQPQQLPPPPHQTSSHLGHLSSGLRPAHMFTAGQQHPTNSHHTQSLKVIYTPNLPPPPPLQLFTYQPQTHLQHHQKPPPAYGTAISQIRSQHNQSKHQVTGSLATQHQHQTLHAHLSLQQQQQQHNLQQHQALHHNLRTQIPPPQPPLPVSIKQTYLEKNSDLPNQNNATTSRHNQSQHNHQQSKVDLTHQQHQKQQEQQKPQPNSENTHNSNDHVFNSEDISNKSSLKVTTSATLQNQNVNLPSYSQVSISPSTASVSMAAVAATTLGRHTNSPFAALLAAAAGAPSPSNTSSVLRYAESPVAHYLERENGDFIVQETPKHIVECVETDSGEFSVIERIYQSPPSVLHIHDDDEDDDEDNCENRLEDDQHETTDSTSKQHDSNDGESNKTKNESDEKQRNTSTNYVKRNSKSDDRNSVNKEIIDFVSISSDSGEEEEFISQELRDHKKTTEKTKQNSEPPTSTVSLPATSTQSSTTASSSISPKSITTKNGDQQLPISTPSTSLHTAASSSLVTANTSSTQQNVGVTCTNNTSNRKKSSKNTITVLSDVQLNLNEYLDLVGNIIASSKVAAQRKTFASIAPIPLVKIEKEEPMDEFITTNTTTMTATATSNNFSTPPNFKANKHETEEITDTSSSSYSKQTTNIHNVILTNKQEQDEQEEKKHQVFVSASETETTSIAISNASTSLTTTINSSHVTSVIRMATTSQRQQQEQLLHSLDNNKDFNEAEDLSQTQQKVQSIVSSKTGHTPLSRKGPKKLVIKPKSTKTEVPPTTTTASKQNQNQINDEQELPTTSANARQEYKKQTSLEDDPLNTTDVKVKNEPITSITYENLPQHSQYQPATSFSILEQHLSSKEPILEFKEEKPCITEANLPSSSIIQEMKAENNVNDDARVLYDFANSKKSQHESPATFPSSKSLFSSKLTCAEIKSFEESQNKQFTKKINHDNDTSSSSSSTYSSHSVMDASLPPEEQNESSNTNTIAATTAQTQHQTNQVYSDFHFNYLYNNGSNNGAPAGAEQTDIKNHQFTPFYQNITNNNNTMLLEESSSSKNYTDYQQLHHNHHLLQQQHQSAGTSHDQWYNNNNYQASQPNVTPITSNHSALNLNIGLSVDGNTAALDGSETSKYLDLDTCKREQNIDIVGDRVTVPPPPPPSSSTSCSFNGTADNSMAGICSTAVILNIRTDEKMPAKGEISEQESNCDIDNSWSQPMYGDISARFFKTTFPGIFPQDNGWNHEEYFSVQDLSASTTAQASTSNRLKSFETANSSNNNSNGIPSFSQNSNDNCNIDVMPSTSAKIRKRRKRSSQDSKASHVNGKRTQPTSTVTSQQMLTEQNEMPGVEFGFQPQQLQQQHHLLQHVQQPSTSTAFLAGPSNASTALSTGFLIQQQQQQEQNQTLQKQRTKVYECGHCNAKYSKLKDRNAHMVEIHNYIRQNRRLVCPTTGLTTPLNISEMQDGALPTSSSAGNIITPELQNIDCVGDYKQGIVKIENENPQRGLPGVEAINPNLSAKSEIMEDDKQKLALVPINTTNSDALEYETKPPTNSLPLSLTTPTSKLTTLYRMLVSFNMTTLKQHQSLTEIDENLIKSSIFFCYICRQNFNSVKLYDAHLTEHPAECFTCGKKFQRWKNFSLHLKRHLGWKEFGCTVCDKKFVVRSALVEHMRMHSGLSPLKCKVCGKHFKRYSNLTQHRKRHTKQIIRRKEYVCYCGEVLPSKARFLWHKETHDSKPKCCPHCCDRFVHVNSLRRHIRLAHSDKFDYTEPMECPICKQIFAKASMKAHMATHSTETQYDCAICSKSFSTKWNLKIHSWVHANRTAKPFKCEHCPKAFVREVDFKNHMNSHKQIKPYTCEVCGCKFIRKYNYMRHRREHHGNKKYTCDLCKKSFHRHYYLIEHRRIHTGERPFQCSICGKSSTTKTNHNKHLKIHHSRDPFTVEV